MLLNNNSMLTFHAKDTPRIRYLSYNESMSIPQCNILVFQGTSQSMKVFFYLRIHVRIRVYGNIE